MRISGENNRNFLSLSPAVVCNTKQLILLKYSHSFLFFWFLLIPLTVGARCSGMSLCVIFIFHFVPNQLIFLYLPAFSTWTKQFNFHALFMLFFCSIFSDHCHSNFSAAYSCYEALNYYYWNRNCYVSFVSYFQAISQMKFNEDMNQIKQYQKLLCIFHSEIWTFFMFVFFLLSCIVL